MVDDDEDPEEEDQEAEDQDQEVVAAREVPVAQEEGGGEGLDRLVVVVDCTLITLLLFLPSDSFLLLRQDLAALHLAGIYN